MYLPSGCKLVIKLVSNLALLQLLRWRTMSFVPLTVDTEFSYQNLPYGVFSTQANVSPFEGRMSLLASPAITCLYLYMHAAY